MPTLVVTRGLPASGKTTWARKWVAEDPVRRARVNRDDTRRALHGRRLGTPEQEKQVTAVNHAAVRDLLRLGVDVVCDDTLLAQRHVRDLRRVAQLAGAEFQVMDFTDVPVEECVRRDAARPIADSVGEDVIRDMWTRYVRGRPHPLPLSEEPADADNMAAPYVPAADAPTAVMVDVDGTVALMCARSPYDESRVHEDTPNPAVIDAVRAAHRAGHRIVFCSGRTDACRDATDSWLAEHVGVPFELFMRKAGDVRKDSVVKLELFDRHIRGRYRVLYVLDDRAQVVAAWRSIGLAVFQVAEGNF